MRQAAWLAAFAIILSAVAVASPQVSILDGTSFRVAVTPDAKGHDTGEKEFEEVLTFADGSVTLSAPKVGLEASPYSVSNVGEKDTTFRVARASSGEGSSVWTGTVHGKDVDGKLVWTKSDGAVSTYTFKGTRLN